MIPDYELLSAIKIGNIAAARLAIERGADIRCSDIQGRTVLQAAMFHGQNDVARYLIAQGADFNERSGENANSLLHRAASTGNFGFASLLLEHNVDVEAVNRYGQRPLHIAVQRSYQFLAQQLLKHGANVCAATSRGDTPLHQASRRGDEGMVNLLLAHNSTSVDRRNLKGWYPITEAAAKGHDQTVSLLLTKGHYSPSNWVQTFLKARLVAEKNGHLKSASVIASAQQRFGRSFGDRVSENFEPGGGRSR